MATPAGITEMIEGQAAGHVTFNEAVVWLETLAGHQIIDFTTTEPVAGLDDGDLWYCNGAATGTNWGADDVADNMLCLYLSGWKYIAPRDGMRFYLDDEKIEVVYREGEWCAPERIWSTTEWAMGKVGQGGTMVYQKSVDLSAMPNNTRTNVAHGISNLDLTAPIMVEGSAWTTAGSDEVYPLNTIGRLGAGSNRYVSCYVDDGTNLWKDANWDASGLSGYVRLEYEKTA